MAWDASLSFTESAVTANKNGTSVKIGPSGLVEGEIDITAVSGTAPTLDIKIQESDDNTNFVDVVSLPRYTVVGFDKFHFKADKPYVRYNVTVTGTSPSFDFKVRLR